MKNYLMNSDEQIASRMGFGSLWELERYRGKMGGYFSATPFKLVRDFRRKVIRREQIGYEDRVHNIVTNQGLNSILDIMFHASTQITTWYVTVFKTNTTPLSTHTYASPGYTECTTTNLDEAVRQAYVEAAASSQSTTNSASPAVYTGDDAHTIYGSSLVGGGSVPTTLADTGGGGTLYSSALYSSSKAMDVDVQLQVTYTLTAADDGV